MPILLLMFCGGVIATRFFAQLPAAGLLGGGLLGLAAMQVAAARLPWRRWVGPPMAAAVRRCGHGLKLGLAWALGVSWASWVAAAALQVVLPPMLEKKDVVVVGQVVGVPTARDGTQRFDFAVDALQWQGGMYPFAGKIRLKMYREQPPIRPGERWRFTARLKQARGYQNPGAGFGYETHLFHHRLRATGYVRAAPMPLLLAARRHSVTALRARLAGFIQHTLGSRPRAGLVAALTVGVRNDMRPADWEVLIKTGTIHLVAISGLHIGLVAGLALALGTLGWRFAGALPAAMPAPKIGVLVGAMAGLGYALLAGMTIPTQRAVCMLMVIAVAMFFQRRALGFETLLLALTAVLVADPLAPLAGGFWLSFGAVAVLMVAAARARREHPAADSSASAYAPRAWYTQPAQRLGRTMAAWSAVQGALFVGMAPLLLILFQRLSLVAPLANLVAIPVVCLAAVPLALLGLLLFMLGLEGAAALAFSASLWVLNALWGLLEWLAALPWAVWMQPAPPLWSLPLAAIGILLLLAPRAMPARWLGLLWVLPLISAVLSGGGASSGDAPLAAGEYRFTTLEIGHGLASVVQTSRHVLVYDTGPKFPGGLDAGASVVAPFLRSQNAAAIDMLIISHGDLDHIGGHMAVLAQFDAADILTSVPNKVANSTACRAGQHWVWDGVVFDMLAPSGSGAKLRKNSPARPVVGNDASCVLRITSPYGTALLTGDIGRATEHYLVRSGLNIAADVLQAPHHGSKTSSTGIFLNHVQPRIAIASTGYLNRYRHPHRVVRKRYLARRIPLYNTADEGAISVFFTTGGIFVQGQRSLQRRYWLLPPRQLTQRIRIDGDAPLLPPSS